MTMDSGVLVENQNMGMFLKTISLKKTKRKHFSAVFSFTSLRYLPRLAMVLV